MSTLELMFDGDIRGYRTGKDCILELANNPLWKDSIKLTPNDMDLIMSESEGYLDAIDDLISNAKAYTDGHTWVLEWRDGSIFAVRDDHDYEQEIYLTT